MSRKKELSGQRFGILKVVKDTGKRTASGRPKHQHGPRPIWKCRCDCGGQVEVSSKDLLRGSKKSCGCLWPEQLRRSNGGSTWQYWLRLKQRGVLSKEWRKSYQRFVKDVGRRPGDQY